MRSWRVATLIVLTCVLAFAFAQAFAGPEDEESSEKSKKEEAPKEATGPKAHYMGEKACKKCHFKQHKVWRATAHAKAWEGLPEDKRAPEAVDEKGRACISCHTVGFGAKDQGGFVDAETSKGLLGVQCESCHGAGSLHIEAAKKLKPKKVDGKTVKRFEEGQEDFIDEEGRDCRSCHSPHFSYKKEYGPKK